MIFLNKSEVDDNRMIKNFKRHMLFYVCFYVLFCRLFMCNNVPCDRLTQDQCFDTIYSEIMDLLNLQVWCAEFMKMI